MNKVNGGDGIPVELFQILKDNAVKVLHSICQQIWKTQQWATGLEKVSFHSNPKERQCQRMLKHNCTHLTSSIISYASKVVLKILQAWLKQYVNHELPDVQPGFRKDRGTRDQIVNNWWIIEKAGEFQTKSTSALLTMPKPLTVWITTNYGKVLKRWPVSWEICMQVRKQQLELDME